ncbi:hypothetical protein [Marinobacter sp. CHS3-4]|uniref:hypothetical protein n=1 Tax=Marinobacter sp. CHS3-4 TaxID=3045174 RepID=UPI0024B509AC|nr:hypothetical protein [Marinobacter sp. CHS3-4]MDI9245977.1 hypothetical protein [Marinobacter sp. CHS3-4]
MTDVYCMKAKGFYDQYQSLTCEQVHQDWLSLLRDKSGLALDVGAGSGRDSSALAARGWDVVAVEAPRLACGSWGRASEHPLDRRPIARFRYDPETASADVLALKRLQSVD